MIIILIIIFILIFISLFIFGWGYVISILGNFKRNKKEDVISNKDYSFTSIICAHNEEKTIYKVLDCLDKQTYNKNDIYVVLDNCTDNTKNEVLKYKNVKILEKNSKASNKGAALEYGIEYLKSKDKLNDIIVIFDADCTLDFNFIEELNNKYKCGSKVVMANSDTQNPCDNIITYWYYIYWKMLTVLSRKPHGKFNLSSNISGCGISFKKEYYLKTKTITEDIEFFMLLSMKNIKVDYIDTISTYQEQPTTFKDMFHQLYRWMNGVRKTNKLYLKKYIKLLFKDFTMIRFDALITSQSCSALGMLILLLIVLIPVVIFYNVNLLIYLLYLFLIILGCSFITSVVVTKKNKKGIIVRIIGSLTYFIFIIILGLVYDFAIFFPSEEWIKIKRKDK